MTFSEVKTFAIREPDLLFGGSFPAVDPKTGISLYSPYSITKNSVRVGIIGDKTTIEQIRMILERIKSPIKGPDRNPTWTPNFPGFSHNHPFKCEIITDDKWYQTIATKEIEALEGIAKVEQRIAKGVEIFMAYLSNIAEREEAPDVVFCAPPKELMRLCISDKDARTRGKRKKSEAEKKYSISENQKTLFTFMPEEYKKERERYLIGISADNFHHLLKAQAMKFDLITQFVLPDTLEAITTKERKPGQKGLQNDATFAWNLAVALLYKSGGRLWRPTSFSTETCFVGISFFKAKEVYGGGMGTSLAQVFTPEGEGLVIRGERFPWSRGISPHLSENASEKLLRSAIDLFTKQTGGRAPTRVVIHKSSKFSDDEIKGFKKAIGDIPRFDFVAILDKARRIRLFREGYHPVLRGTMITLPDKSWLLYTNGYIPFMKLYPGPHIPRPLEIIQHVGDTLPEKISEEILVLTKLNWNNADFASNHPITLQFSKQVGRILREMPSESTPKNKYMYYM